jgi:hypothetical protein
MLGRPRFLLLATVSALVLLLPRLGYSALDGNELLKECRAYTNLLNLPNARDTDDPDVLRALGEAISQTERTAWGM